MADRADWIRGAKQRDVDGFIVARDTLNHRSFPVFVKRWEQDYMLVCRAISAIPFHRVEDSARLRYPFPLHKGRG